MTTDPDNGTCEVEFEEPLIVMRMIGTPGAAEMRRVLSEIDEKTKAWRFNVTLVDLTKQLHSPSVETRKAIADASKSFVPSRGTALFGTTFAMRTLGALVMNVISIKNGTQNVSKFFSTEAEARAWLNEQAAAET
jgi:hypothetical protein